MTGELLYLDASALVKLVLPEAESAALLAVLEAWPIRMACEIARVEVMRAASRASKDAAVERRAEEVIAGLHLLKLDDEILMRAARLEPRTLRTLDALHLAAALSLEDDLGAMAVYDAVLAEAAAASGISVIQPGSRT